MKCCLQFRRERGRTWLTSFDLCLDWNYQPIGSCLFWPSRWSWLLPDSRGPSLWQPLWFGIKTVLCTMCLWNKLPLIYMHCCLENSEAVHFLICTFHAGCWKIFQYQLWFISFFIHELCKCPSCPVFAASNTILIRSSAINQPSPFPSSAINKLLPSCGHPFYFYNLSKAMLLSILSCSDRALTWLDIRFS